MTQIKIDETIGLFFIEMDNQLKKYALQLTNNYQEAIDLLTESKRVIINNYSSNINDLKWYIYKTIKDVHISLYKEQICNSILMDNKNDCYLVLSDATIITINSPFHVDVAKNSLKHLNALQILFNRAIKNHNPK